MSLSLEEIDSWAREAAKHKVCVTFRVQGQKTTITRSMAHPEYLRFVTGMPSNGYEFVSAEQTRNE